MGRKKTELTNGFEKPGVGQSYIVLKVSDGTFHRARTLANRDVKSNPELKPIAKFSGDAPQFKAQLYKQDVFLTFHCGPDRAVVATGDGEYHWTGIALKDAREQGMDIVGDVKKAKKNVTPAPAVETESEVDNLSDSDVEEEEVAKETEVQVEEESTTEV